MNNSSKEKVLTAIEQFIIQREKKMQNRDDIAKNLLIKQGFTENKWSLTQLHIIALINENPNKANNAFLANELGISKPAITKAVRSLIKEELILPKQKENNQKSIYYTLTSSGKQLSVIHDQVHQVAQDRYKQLLEQFTDDESEIIVKFLNTWSEHL